MDGDFEAGGPGGRGESGPAPAGVDTAVAHSARVWNYWLGGKDNYAADREVGDYVFAAYPEIVEAARADRAFLVRAVTHLAREEGVRQFLDIGTGLPTHNNTHEVAQAAAPESRVVYVDNDPLVLAHARALLVGSPEGATDYIDADLREPDAVLEKAGRLLDLSRPVALTVLGTMGHMADTGEAHALVARYMAALPSGSLLALCDGSSTSPEMVEAADRWNATAALPYHLRTPEEIAGFFTGLDLLAPGVVSATRWRPDTDASPTRDADQYCGVARKG